MLKGLKVVKKSTTDQQVQKRELSTTEMESNIEPKRARTEDRNDNTVQRDSWMLSPPTNGIFPNRNDNSENRCEVQRELNPYFANGGTGLPPQQSTPESHSILNAKSSNWRQRALMRAQERARMEGKDVNEFLKDHWGVTSSEMQNSIRQKALQTTLNTRKDEESIQDKVRRIEHSINQRPKMHAPDKKSINDLRWKRNESEDQNSNMNVESEKETQKNSSYASSKFSQFASNALSVNDNKQCLTSEQTLKDIIRETKENGVDNFDIAMLNKMGENTKYSKEWQDEYDETTSGMERFGTRNESTKNMNRKRAQEKQLRNERNEKNKQIKAFHFEKGIYENCPFCYRTNKNFKKHLIIALGEKTYLTIPPFGSLVEGHCIISTFQHHTSIYDTDEDEWHEIQKFKQSLKKMFAAKNKDVLFMETVTPYSLRKQKHAFIECIPLSIQVFQEAPGYFKKALMESDTEYSDNIKVIDTRGKGIKKSIPRGFPYFHVEFGINGGFAHVIEDESKFSYLLGREVVCGMLKRNSNEAKLRGQSFEEEKRCVLQFVDSFKDFDWTTELEGGSY